MIVALPDPPAMLGDAAMQVVQFGNDPRECPLHRIDLVGRTRHAASRRAALISAGRCLAVHGNLASFYPTQST